MIFYAKWEKAIQKRGLSNDCYVKMIKKDK